MRQLNLRDLTIGIGGGLGLGLTLAFVLIAGSFWAFALIEEGRMTQKLSSTEPPVEESRTVEADLSGYFDITLVSETGSTTYEDCEILGRVENSSFEEQGLGTWEHSWLAVEFRNGRRGFLNGANVESIVSRASLH